MIKVSVVVPIYNKEKYLKTNIESILNQTLKEIEIILIDDGSSDMSEKICKEYQKKDKRLVYIKTKNNGVSSARNSGLKIARGKFCIFIDADDFIENNMLKEMYELAIKKNAESVICGIKEVDKKESFSKEISFNIEYKKEKEYKFSEIIKISSIIFHSTGNKLFLREIIQKNNIFFIENIHSFEDLNFVFKYFLFSQKNYLLNKSFYNYFRNEDSVTKNTKKVDKKDFFKNNLNNLKVFFDMKKFLYQKNKSEFIKELEYKIKEFDIFNLGYKNLQNFYIKDETLKMIELIKELKKYENCVQKKFNTKIKKILKIRLIIIIIFRNLLILSYKKWR